MNPAQGLTERLAAMEEERDKLLAMINDHARAHIGRECSSCERQLRTYVSATLVAYAGRISVERTHE